MKKILERESPIFETPDINIAATVLGFGIPLLGINRSDPAHCLFQFENSIRVKSIARGFWSRELMMDPFVVLTALKSIKGQLYDERV